MSLVRNNVMKKRLLSTLIVIAMIIGIMPNSIFADAANPDGSQTGDYGTFIDGDHVISDMISKSGQNGHPRIIMTEEKFARLKAHLGDGSTTDVLLGKLKETADSKMNLPLVQYEISGGIRLLENCKSIQRRVAALALAYNIYGDERYAERAYRELENAANFPDWNPYHFLDTGEMCTAFAIGYDWLYDWMDDDQREVLRTAMIEKGLNQVMQDYEHNVAYSKTRGSRGDDGKRSYVWYENDMGDNWKFVCIGGTNLAALAIGDEPDAKNIASKVLDYGCKKAYTSVRDGYKLIDGSYIEGLGYWDYATYYLGLISSSLISTTGTDYGIADYEGLRKSVDFVRYMSSNTPKSFSFGDDGDSRDTGWAVFLWLGDYYNSREISSVRLKKIAAQEFNYLDVLWINEDTQGSSELDSSTDWGSVGSSNASFRTSWDESGLVAALHVGVNDIMFHGHFDLGSFYVESNGTRFFTDLGNEKNYELPNRKYSYRLKAEGHNTLVINPSTDFDQVEDAECLITDYRGGDEAYAVTDLTAAYKDSGATSVVRGLQMIKDKNCVIVQDEISLNKAGEIYWFAHTTGQISVAADGKSAIVTSGSDKLWVGLISDEGTFSVMNAELLPTSRPVSGQTSNSDYRKLAIHLTDTKDTTITVACIPLKNGESQPSWTPAVKSISSWGSGGEPPVVKYGITVDSGNSDKVEAETGETVTITAGEPAEGKEFDKWVVDSGSITLSNATSASTTFTMPEEAVKVTATYKDKPVTKYTVTVNYGASDKTEAEEGETITLTADDPDEGKVFDKWTVDSGVISLSMETDSKATFTMPKENVEVTATYKEDETKVNDPGTGEPQNNDPGTGEPQNNDPGIGEPQNNDPGTGEPQGNEPGTGEIQGNNDPGTGEPQNNDPGTGEPQNNDPGIGEPQNNDPGTGEEINDPPATKGVISFELDGGTLDGETTFTVEAEIGDIITIPTTIPVKEGYKFTYWKGSEYYPGDSYEVKGDHTLTAQWEVDDQTSQSNQAGTTTQTTTQTSKDTAPATKSNEVTTEAPKTQQTTTEASKSSEITTEAAKTEQATTEAAKSEKATVTTEVNNSDNSKNMTSQANAKVTSQQPSTKDSSSPILWIFLMALSIVGIVAVIEYKKYKKDQYYVEMK